MLSERHPSAHHLVQMPGQVRQRQSACREHCRMEVPKVEAIAQPVFHALSQPQHLGVTQFVGQRLGWNVAGIAQRLGQHFGLGH